MATLPILELHGEDAIDPPPGLDDGGEEERYELVTRRINSLTELLKAASSSKNPAGNSLAALAIQSLSQLLTSGLAEGRADG